MIQRSLFLDSSYAIALVSTKDTHHKRATEIARILKANDTKLITSYAILLEIGNALSGSRYRHAAGALINALRTDPLIEAVEVSAELYAEGFGLFVNRPDKKWGMVDCTSFVIMQRKNITQALTADEHSVQAGFQALLLTPFA